MMGGFLLAALLAVAGLPENALVASAPQCRNAADLARFVRGYYDITRIEPSWKPGGITGGRLGSLKAEAARIMAFRLKATGYTHQFPTNRVDWVVNPSIGAYQEWP